MDPAAEDKCRVRLSEGKPDARGKMEEKAEARTAEQCARTSVHVKPERSSDTGERAELYFAFGSAI